MKKSSWDKRLLAKLVVECRNASTHGSGCAVFTAGRFCLCGIVGIGKGGGNTTFCGGIVVIVGGLSRMSMVTSGGDVTTVAGLVTVASVGTLRVLRGGLANALRSNLQESCEAGEGFGRVVCFTQPLDNKLTRFFIRRDVYRMGPLEKTGETHILSEGWDTSSVAGTDGAASTWFSAGA